MATVNSMSFDSVVLDPFRFQETVLMNFLRSQSLLPGPCIRRFPHEVSTSPYSWADVTDDDPSCNVSEPVDSKKAEEQVQHRFSKEISEFSISLETPWSTSSNLHDSILFYLIQWPESVMRAKITLEGQCDLATCLADNITMHALTHLQVLLSDFIDFDRRRWEAISAASGPIMRNFRPHLTSNGRHSPVYTFPVPCRYIYGIYV